MKDFWDSRNTEELLWLIPVALVGYVFVMNFAVFGQDQVYMVDIGSDSDMSGEAKLTGPNQRISDRLNEGNLTYRNFEGSLVYFTAERPNFLGNSSRVVFEIRFEESVPDNAKFMIGAKDRADEWSYNWDTVYTESADTIRSVKDLSFERHGDWMVARASWNASEVYTGGENLNFVTNAEFLKNRDKGLKVDRIKITIERQPVWQRY